MSKEDKKNKLYVYFDRFIDGVSGTYDDLECKLGIDRETCRRIIEESDDIIATVRGIGNKKETHWILKKYKNNEIKNYIATKQNEEIMTEPIETKEIKFNSRQHRLCDYLLEFCLGKENKIDKVELLWELKEEYFDENTSFSPGDEVFVTKEMIKKSRYNFSEHTRLTNDLSFINRHGEIRQILIGSKSGIDNGVWALRVGEQHDVIDSKFGDGLKILTTAWRMKKTAEKQGNCRLVFKNEKAVLDVLRQFDN